MAALPWWRHRVRLLVAGDAIEGGWGDPVRWANEALEVFRARGETRLAARCRSVYRQAQVPVRRQGRGGTPVPPELAGYGISPREMDVLTLAAAGLTDQEIADRLVISPRTVASHLDHVRTKTGAASRADVIQLLN